VYECSANIELLFREAGSAPASRIRAAAGCGFQLVEMWNWRDKDLAALTTALAETGTRLQALCVEPMGRLVDRSTHAQFLAGLQDSIPVAERLGSPFLYLIAGDSMPGVDRAEQHRAVVAALSRAADLLDGHEVMLLLENLNSRVNHVGTFLDSSRETIQIVREVGAPTIAMLYDVYHSLAMGEQPIHELAGATDLVKHVQIADLPGQGEPGSGQVDWWRVLTDLRGLGYTGVIGLEYVPTVETTRSIAEILHIAAQV
jgi:hydroxypyruvate isomerase